MEVTDNDAGSVKKWSVTKLSRAFLCTSDHEMRAVY
jgi:hypothetical protein